MSMQRRPRLLAVSSGGGHWAQMMRIRRAFDEADVTYVTVEPGYRADVGDAPLHIVPDANKDRPLRAVQLAGAIARIVLRERPDVVFSTGAAPGCLTVILGRLLGARTIWLDSIANAERISLSGRLVRPFASVWLTQWEHLARGTRPEYAGQVF
jgi:UDP-N-acetylglucosamine:LPS N-acetylglucosamine transferase